MTGPDRGVPEAADSLEIGRHFGFCTPKELNIITKVLFNMIELKLLFLRKTIDCKGDTRFLSYL